LLFTCKSNRIIKIITSNSKTTAAKESFILFFSSCFCLSPPKSLKIIRGLTKIYTERSTIIKISLFRKCLNSMFFSKLIKVTGKYPDRLKVNYFSLRRENILLTSIDNTTPPISVSIFKYLTDTILTKV